MAKTTRSKKTEHAFGRASGQKAPEVSTSQPWINLRTGLILIGVLSVGFGIYVGWQILPGLGWKSAVLWGLGSAVAIWAVFLFSLVLNATIRGKKPFS